jgi:uncharacterized protein YjbI with pentapeptide repeats
MSLATDGIRTGESITELEQESVRSMAILLLLLLQQLEQLAQEDAQRVLDELSVEKVALEDFQALSQHLTIERVSESEFVSEMNGLFKEDLTIEKISQAIEQSKPTPEIEQSKIGLGFLADLTGSVPIELTTERLDPASLEVSGFSFERINPAIALEADSRSPLEMGVVGAELSEEQKVSLKEERKARDMAEMEMDFEEEPITNPAISVEVEVLAVEQLNMAPEKKIFQADIKTEAIDLLIKDEDAEVRIQAAKLENLSPEQIDTLLIDDDWLVRNYIADRNDLSSEQIDKLIVDNNSFVRMGVANREDLNLEQIDLLVNDEDRNIREAMSSRKDLTVGQIDLLSNDPEVMVREAIALHNIQSSAQTTLILGDEIPSNSVGATTLILDNEPPANNAPQTTLILGENTPENIVETNSGVSSHLKEIGTLELMNVLIDSDNFWQTQGLDADSLELLKIPEGKIADLSYTDLSSSSLTDGVTSNESVTSGINLRNVNLYGANLEGSNLSNADLSNARLSNVNLSGANLEGASLDSANLIGANLEHINLSNADMSNVWFQDANLEGANLQGANLQGANLEGADLRLVNLEGVNLEGANLQGSNLQGVNLEGVNLQGANLVGANLDRANLDGANITGAIFNQAPVIPLAVESETLPLTELQQKLIDHKIFLETTGNEGTIADLSSMNLRGENFRGMDLMKVNFQGADLDGADFQGADLDGADFQGANLNGADFRDTNLRGANFLGADLSSTNFSRTDLDGAIFDKEDIRDPEEIYEEFLNGYDEEHLTHHGQASEVEFPTRIASEYDGVFIPNRLENSMSTENSFSDFSQYELSEMNGADLLKMPPEQLQEWRDSYKADLEAERLAEEERYADFQDYIEEVDEANPDRYNQFESSYNPATDVKVFKTVANDSIGDGSIVTAPKEAVLVYGKDADGSIVNTLSDAEVEAIVQILNSPIDGNVIGGENLRIRYKGEILAETDANGNVVINELAGLDLPENFTEKLREALGQNRQEPILETPVVEDPVVETPVVESPSIVSMDRVSDRQIESLLDYTNQWIPPGSAISKDSPPIDLSTEQLPEGVLISLTDKAEGELKLLVREDNSVDVLVNKSSVALQEQFDIFPEIIDNQKEAGKYNFDKQKDFTINDETTPVIDPTQLIADMEERLAQKQTLHAENGSLDVEKSLEIGDIQAKIDFMKALYAEPVIEAIDEKQTEFEKATAYYAEKGGSGTIIAEVIQEAIPKEAELELPGKDISVKGVGKDHRSVKVMAEWMQSNQSEAGFPDVNGITPNVIPDGKGNLNYILAKDDEIIFDANYNLASHTMTIDREATPITPELREIFAEMKEQLQAPAIVEKQLEAPIVEQTTPALPIIVEPVEILTVQSEATNEQILDLLNYTNQHMPPGSSIAKDSPPLTLSVDRVDDGLLVNLTKEGQENGQLTLLVREDNSVDVLVNKISPPLQEQLNLFPDILDRQKESGEYDFNNQKEFTINEPVEKTIERVIEEVGLEEKGNEPITFIDSKQEDVVRPYGNESDGYLKEQARDFMFETYPYINGENGLKFEDLDDPTLEQIDLLVKANSPELRKNMAERDDLSPEQIDILAKDDIWFVRQAVSERDDLTPEQIDAFSKDIVQQIRKNMAERDDLSPEQIDVLSKDSNAQVRESVSDRTVAPDDISIDPDKLNGLAKWIAEAEMVSHELSGGVTANVGLTTEDVKACIFIDGDSAATVLLEDNAAVLQPKSSITPNITAAIAEVAQKAEEISVDIEAEIEPEVAKDRSPTKKTRGEIATEGEERSDEPEQETTKPKKKKRSLEDIAKDDVAKREGRSGTPDRTQER